MTTITAVTTVEGQVAAESLGAAMERLDPAPDVVGVSEIADGSGRWEVGGQFTAPPDAAALALLSVAYGASPFKVSELAEVDWVAKVRRELAPVEAGRFFVHGAHDAGRVPDGTVALLIEASMAFGTGHHETTRGCLLALEELIEENGVAERVADIGCGTAVLAMAAAKAGSKTVIASDIDPDAVAVARANIIANGLGGQVECVEAAGFGHAAIETTAPFDLVFANILKGPLVDLAPDMASRIRTRGCAILSGILTGQADEVSAVYSRTAFNVRSRLDIGEWSCLTVCK